jgi:hypothetical protein
MVKKKGHKYYATTTTLQRLLSWIFIFAWNEMVPTTNGPRSVFFFFFLFLPFFFPFPQMNIMIIILKHPYDKSGKYLDMLNI